MVNATLVILEKGNRLAGEALLERESEGTGTGCDVVATTFGGSNGGSSSMRDLTVHVLAVGWGLLDVVGTVSSRCWEAKVLRKRCTVVILSPFTKWGSLFVRSIRAILTMLETPLEDLEGIVHEEDVAVVVKGKTVWKQLAVGGILWSFWSATLPDRTPSNDNPSVVLLRLCNLKAASWDKERESFLPAREFLAAELITLSTKNEN
jgi:hypothetical protein